MYTKGTMLPNGKMLVQVGGMALQMEPDKASEFMSTVEVEQASYKNPNATAAEVKSTLASIATHVAGAGGVVSEAVSFGRQFTGGLQTNGGLTAKTSATPTVPASQPASGMGGVLTAAALAAIVLL